MTDTIPLGTVIRPYGEVVAVGYVGDRYYWMKDDDGTISMILSDVIELMADDPNLDHS